MANKLFRFFALFVILSTFVCCSSTEPDPEPDFVPENDSGSEIAALLDSTSREIIAASPDSLQQAYADLEQSEAGETERGMEYKYIIVRILDILYPEMAGSVGDVVPPATSIYPDFFDSIQLGLLPELDVNTEVSFLTKLLMPLTILNATDENTLDLALEELGEVELMDPLTLSSSVLPPYLRGVVDERNGDFDRAITYYERALFADSSMYKATLGSYRILVSTGKFEAANELESELDSIVGTISAYRYYKALRLLGQGDIESSSVIAAALTEDQPKNREYQLLRARILYLQNRFQQAKLILDTLREERYTKPAEFYLYYSKVYRALDDVEKAKTIIEEGLATYPGRPDLKDEYIIVLLKSGDVKQGSELIAEGTENEESKREAIELLLDISIADGDYNNAWEFVQTLLEMERTNEYLKKAAIVSQELGLLEEARQYIEEVFSKSSDPEIILIYIEILFQLGNDTEVYNLITEGLETYKDGSVKSTLYYYLATRFSRTRKERQTNLLKAIIEDTTNIDARINLAEFYLEIGEMNQAKVHIDQIRNLDPNNPALPRLEERLR